MTLSVANMVNGNMVSYILSIKMMGAQTNQPRAQQVTDSIRILRFASGTSSAVQLVSKHRPVDVANLMAIVGNISNATTWVSSTAIEKYREKIKEF